MMTPAEHAAEAERLVDVAMKTPSGLATAMGQNVGDIIAAAQVHATLATFGAPASPVLALAAAYSSLKRLADPTEIGGFGDADSPHNNSVEMQARLRYAKRAAERLYEATEGILPRE